MENIKQEIIQALHAVWAWLLTADETTIVSVLMIIAGSTIVSYVVQHFKRQYNIDLWAKGKAAIYALLTVLSSVAAIADWYLLNTPQGFGAHFLIFGASTYTIATWVHRAHVSPMYDKLTNALKTFADDVAAVREARKTKIVIPPAPAYLEPEAPTRFDG